VLALTKHLAFEVLECNHYNCNVIEGLPVERILEDALYREAWLLVHVLSQFLVFVVHCDTVPGAGGNILIGKFVKDAIASQDYKVMILINLECFDIWLANNYTRVAPTEFVFGFRVAKCPGDWEPTR
jgi:hypothetical protein